MNHPGIWQLGRITDDGHTIAITGWGLSYCASRCDCHDHPRTGHMAILENQTDGVLGLVKYRDCDCCQPWTVDELLEMLAVRTELATLA